TRSQLLCAASHRSSSHEMSLAFKVSKVSRGCSNGVGMTRSILILIAAVLAGLSFWDAREAAVARRECVAREKTELLAPTRPFGPGAIGEEAAAKIAEQRCL